jgi:hypothetical protein
MAIDWNDQEFAFLKKQIRAGRVSLFLGAGFSVAAKNGLGETPPLGNPLAEILAAEAGFDYTGEYLATVYEAAQKHLGTARLWELLRKNYDIYSFADWYKIVADITWHRIYTLNIDNLVQKIYQSGSTQRLRTIINPAPVEERDPHFGSLQCVHLHGFVETPDKGLTFSLPDFGNMTARPNPWYQAFVDDLYNRSVIFIGTQLEEPMFHHYLQMRDAKDRQIQEYRPKSYLVNRTIGKMRITTLKERNITGIESTAEEFFRALARAVNLDELSIASVRKEAFPHLIFREGRTSIDERVNRHFDLIRTDALPFTRKTPPDDFFMGAEPNWSDIAEERDAIRTIETELLSNLPEERQTFSVVVLHGPAGSGKTTAMMRTAQMLAAKGSRVYYAQGHERIDLSGLLDVAQEAAKDKARIFIFMDVLSRHMGTIDYSRGALRAADNVTLILCDRTNKYAPVSHALAEFNPIDIRMPDLDVDDVKAIIAKLENFGFLGALRDKTPEQRLSAFMDRASKQLLVALREATSGNGFDLILRDEYNGLVPMAQLAYTICCIAVAHGAPGVYTRHLMPCLGRAEFSKGVVIRDLLRGVLVPANQAETMLKPRHRLIASWVANEIAPVGQKVDAITSFLRQISSDIVPNEIKRRSPAYMAYRGMINSEGLKETFANDSTIVLGVYEELKSVYNHDFLFWLQYGMAQINAGHLDVAENYINQSLGIYPYSHQTKHHLGCLRLLQAAKAPNPAISVDRANEGIALLTEQIQTKGDENSYPYHAYLVYVCRWYQRAGTLISQKEWEKLRSIGKEAQKNTLATIWSRRRLTRSSDSTCFASRLIELTRAERYHFYSEAGATTPCALQ